MSSFTLSSRRTLLTTRFFARGSFTSLALKAVAAQAVKKQTGARGLRRIMENVLLDSMYEAPQSVSDFFSRETCKRDEATNHPRDARFRAFAMS